MWRERVSTIIGFLIFPPLPPLLLHLFRLYESFDLLYVVMVIFFRLSSHPPPSPESLRFTPPRSRVEQSPPPLFQILFVSHGSGFLLLRSPPFRQDLFPCPLYSFFFPATNERTPPLCSRNLPTTTDAVVVLLLVFSPYAHKSCKSSRGKYAEMLQDAPRYILSFTGLSRSPDCL